MKCSCGWKSVRLVSFISEGVCTRTGRLVAECVDPTFNESEPEHNAKARVRAARQALRAQRLAHHDESG